MASPASSTGRSSHSEVLGDTIDEAIRFRSSCGFMLVAIDNLGRINESLGFDVADQVIAAVAKRLHTADARGKDTLGRYSGNKFGLVLRDCTPDDLAVAAERMLSGVREEEMVPTSAGPIAVTVTISGLTMRRGNARGIAEVLSRVQETLGYRQTAPPRLVPRLSAEYRARCDAARDRARHRRDRRRARTERRIFPGLRNHRYREGPHAGILLNASMRIRRADGSLIAANDVIPVAERLGLVRLLDHRVLELVVDEMVATPALRASFNVSAAS